MDVGCRMIHLLWRLSALFSRDASVTSANSPTSARLRIAIPAGSMSPELQKAFRRAKRRQQLMKPVIRRALDHAADEIVRTAHINESAEASDKEPKR
jgi:hypothetical protein